MIIYIYLLLGILWMLALVLSTIIVANRVDRAGGNPHLAVVFYPPVYVFITVLIIALIFWLK